MKCAIYAYYSSGRQRDASIADQIGKCRDFAAAKGRLILEDYVGRGLLLAFPSQQLGRPSNESPLLESQMLISG